MQQRLLKQVQRLNYNTKVASSGWMRLNEQTKKVIPKMVHAFVIAHVNEVIRKGFTQNFSSKKNVITLSKN